ncbi:MAG: alpha-2-macroglobulin, partial [Deltaproteobacteria bacterium]|nr:alpha-2-macroglobulin [Deltaproteobacteria bacterium]
FISARVNDDFSFVLSSWDEGLEPWRYGVYANTWWGNEDFTAQSVLARTLLKRGEIVEMKHFFRRRTGGGFAIPIMSELPRVLTLHHWGSDDTYNVPLTWSSDGTAANEFTLPPQAKLGTYDVRMSSGGGRTYTTAQFSVEDYRVPLMRGFLKLPEKSLPGRGTTVLDLGVRYLAGGGAGGLPVKLRYYSTPHSFSFERTFPEFIFGDEGDRALNAQTTLPSEEWNGESESLSSRQGSEIRTRELSLDREGNARVEITDLPPVQFPSQLRAEVEYQDPNGEVQTFASTVPMYPSTYLVGMKRDSWANVKGDLAFDVAVVDLEGKGVSAVPVKVRLYQRQVYSVRKKLLGGMFGYSNAVEMIPADSVCETQTGKNGTARCRTKLPLSGNFLLEAVAFDPQGSESKTASSIWVANGDEWWFEQANNDRIELLPEQPTYEPGQTAKLQLRMPFRDATVLVTVEREGVLDSFVTSLTRSNPVLSLPIRENYAPNIVVSAVAVRGRTGDFQPTALVDLSKPAFKMGMSNLNVSRQGYELKVDVAPEKKVYQVRETATVNFRVHDDQVQTPAAIAGNNGEIAVAVIDEGLLELKDNDTWNLLERLLTQRSSTVRTVTSAMHVIGKRHFGLKALPFGGGGGKSFTRDLFDTRVFWSARVPVQQDGTATVSFPLNDSLTSFRIAAIASAGALRFGTGYATLRTTKDVMLFPGISPVAREGDQADIELTVRNASERPIQLAIKGELSSDDGEQLPSLNFAAISLAPGQSEKLRSRMTVPLNLTNLAYEFTASEGSIERDRVRIPQKVIPALPVRTVQATLTQLDGKFTLPAKQPADSLPGKGGLNIVFEPSLATALDGVRDYMRNYPFSCLEQKISKAVALDDKEMFQRIADSLPTYIDSSGFAKYFPNSPTGSETLTAYLLSVLHERGWQIPADSQQQLLSALEGFVEGRLTKGASYPGAPDDLRFRKLAALEALSRYGRGEKMVSALWVDPNSLPTSAVLDMMSAVTRFTDLSERSKRLAKIEQVLRSRLLYHGTTLSFSTEQTDSLWWLMVSNDVNVTRLMLLLLNDMSPSWKKDFGRLARGMTERLRNGHWDLTLANVWGTLALERFAEKVEGGQPSGVTKASFGEQSTDFNWSLSSEGGSFKLPWPSGEATLDVTHEGEGKPWLLVRSEAALILKAPLSAGYVLKREIVPVERKRAGEWHVGDILRVDLTVDPRADRSWVVVDDPVPSGASILATGGKRTSMVADGAQNTQSTYPTFEERAYESYRSYYEYLPRGTHTASYLLRLNTPGEFLLPPSRVEAMYSPEMFGEFPNERFVILP